MSTENNNNVSCGCGCFTLIISIISICFFISWLVRACESGSAWEGAVQTVKDYKTTADSIWNE